MSPEFAMGDIVSTEIQGASGVVHSEAKPKANGRGHWSAIEIQEWRKKIGEAFDQMAHLGDVARFEKEHDVEQHPKPNGFQRLTNLGKNLEKDVRVEAEEEVLGEEPLGYGPEVNIEPENPGRESSGH